MKLPADFHFTQASLQDYVDCPRRFQLRYVHQVAWPALEAEPGLETERAMLRGAAFHRMVHQHILGVPAERLARAAMDPHLERWWHRYMRHGLTDLPAARYSEIALSAPFGGYRLLAKYDLVAVEVGRRGVIVDWKTSRKRPGREFMAERLQTRVYPYLLVRAGAHINDGRSFMPEQVEMIYWFAEFPDEPIHFIYDAARYEADGDYLLSLVRQIEALGDESFPLTAQTRRCLYCPYRSLCRRGAEAGPLDEMEDEAAGEVELALDFDQIAEIAF